MNGEACTSRALLPGRPKNAYPGLERQDGELYSRVFAGMETAPLLGFLIAGYSGRSMQAEAWVVQMDDPAKRPSLESAASQGESGWLAYARPQAAVRLLKGESGCPWNLPNVRPLCVYGRHMPPVASGKRADQGKAAQSSESPVGPHQRSRARGVPGRRGKGMTESPGENPLGLLLMVVGCPYMRDSSVQRRP